MKIIHLWNIDNFYVIRSHCSTGALRKLPSPSPKIQSIARIKTFRTSSTTAGAMVALPWKLRLWSSHSWNAAPAPCSAPSTLSVVCFRTNGTPVLRGLSWASSAFARWPWHGGLYTSTRRPERRRCHNPKLPRRSSNHSCKKLTIRDQYYLYIPHNNLR